MKWFLISLILLSQSLLSQDIESSRRIIAFYNLENLFDTIDDPDTYDEDYTPSGKLNYTSFDYGRKLRKLSSIIRKIGSDESDSGPHILGVSEVENRQVLEDLISQPELDSLSYAIAHVESPDLRGIDVALIYREDIFFHLPMNHLRFVSGMIPVSEFSHVMFCGYMASWMPRKFICWSITGLRAEEARHALPRSE